VDSVSYTTLDQPLQYTMGTSSEPVYITDSYDPQTGDLTQQDTRTGTGQTQVDDLNFTYNDIGSVTSEADTPSGAPSATDVRCFQYDYLGRLVQAWAQGSTGCASTPSASAEGGAAPYWNSYTYNTIGDMTGITSTTPAGAVTTAADTYPAAGAAQPHAITGEKITSPAGNVSASYGYNADGELTSVTGSTAGNQALTWNDAGQLSQDAVTPAGGTAQDTNYIYDANGALLLTADPGSTTLYLDDEELSLSGGAVSGTRYYSVGGATVATLTSGTGVSYVVGDPQGTRTVAISASNLAVTRRYYDPYGNPIGPAPSSFPAGEKGFVGGIADTATGLTDLGIRELQPGTGSFISADPILTPYDPQGLNGYAYAGDNPATDSDPTGAKSCNSYNPGSTAWLHCEGLKQPFSIVMGNLEKSLYKACISQPGYASWDSTTAYLCRQQAVQSAARLLLNSKRPGRGCKWGAILSYAAAGGYMVGEAQGHALSAQVAEGVVAAEEAAAVAPAVAVVGAILGSLFLFGLAVVVVASC
jgi:RHS repeat-associated protein